MIKNLSAFIAKTTFNRAIEGVHITPEAIVATDSFKLIEIKTIEYTESFTVKLPKGLKTFEKIEPTGNGTDVEVHNKGVVYKCEKIDDIFPEYKKVFPTTEPLATVTLSPEHLKAICEAYGDKSMTIDIYEHGKPVVFSEMKGKIRALLMPIVR